MFQPPFNLKYYTIRTVTSVKNEPTFSIGFSLLPPVTAILVSENLPLSVSPLLRERITMGHPAAKNRFKLPLNPLKYPFHWLRQLVTQPVFWLLIFLGPIFHFFRVDMLSQVLIFFGKQYPFEFQYVMWLPITFYGGVLAIAFSSALLGRVFCGWVCPHNTLTEWTRALRRWVGREPKSPRDIRLIKKHPTLQWLLPSASIGIALLLTFSLSVCLSSYIVPPQWILKQYASGSPHIALLFGHGLFTLIGLFLLYCGHDFCRTCCPYGMGQSISAYQGGKWRPMEIQFQGSSIQQDCGSCRGCESACPVNIDPRQPEGLKVGVFDGCFNCGDCIDACNYIHQNRPGSGLLSFSLPFVSKKQPPSAPTSSKAS